MNCVFGTKSLMFKSPSIVSSPTDPTTSITVLLRLTKHARSVGINLEENQIGLWIVPLAVIQSTQADSSTSITAPLPLVKDARSVKNKLE